MEESTLKTSWKQRLLILGVAVLLLGSTIAVYIMIVLGNGNINYAKMSTDKLQTAYEDAYSELEARGAELSSTYFEEFKSYKSKIKAFNSASANSDGIKTKDFKEGDGDDLTNDNYAAYYIGYCSDETIFDSSFDNPDEPTALKSPILVQPDSLIEGWYLGVSGMKMNGVREITIPSSLAYGETEICGGANSPLRFIIYAVPKDDQLVEIDEKLDKIYNALANAYASEYSNYSDLEDASGAEAPETEDAEEAE